MDLSVSKLMKIYRRFGLRKQKIAEQIHNCTSDGALHLTGTLADYSSTASVALRWLSFACLGVSWIDHQPICEKVLKMPEVLSVPDGEPQVSVRASIRPIQQHCANLLPMTTQFGVNWYRTR